jgi:hypothetical protein
MKSSVALSLAMASTAAARTLTVSALCGSNIPTNEWIYDG